jgi:hypothetical protein
MTQLIELSGVRRVVIGCSDPIPERATKGASQLHSVGIAVVMNSVLLEESERLIQSYSERANSKLKRMARKHFELFQRPLGFLHCSVVDSDNIEAFARQGNAFGHAYDGKRLSFRDFGSYEIAPPPDVIWADELQDDNMEDDFETDETALDENFFLDFEDESYQESMAGSPMMPWYVSYHTC